MPRASILIPAYNSAATLPRCLASACAQTLQDIEILVADDASTDDTAAIVAALALKDSRIRLTRLVTNGGKPRAMNLLAAQAQGDWIAVLDADDAYRPERLATLIAAAEDAGVDMAADNLLYVDAGVPSEAMRGFGTILRSAFDADLPQRIIGKAELCADADSFGDFDYGILKPVLRRHFIERHALSYYEDSRLAEDFTYLMTYFVAGGSCVLCSTPLYEWTMPFGTISRRWTQTGAGAWRYDYRQALSANEHFVRQMRSQGEDAIVAMLERRAQQYRVMIHYIGAQKQAAEGRHGRALLTLLTHPSIWRLLASRVSGRLARAMRRASEAPA